MAHGVTPINYLANRDDVIYRLSVRLVVDIVDDLVRNIDANPSLSDIFNNSLNTHYNRRYSIYGNPLHSPVRPDHIRGTGHRSA